VKYALDTNIFVDGFRSEDGRAEVLAFLEAARDVERGVFDPFERRRHVFTPSAAAFVLGGRALAAVAAREGWQLIDENPSLLNDALIAASCREHGITLITRDRDFKRLEPFLRGLRYVEPWPQASSVRG
jgi:predicted nucleic acid-binding protein